MYGQSFLCISLDAASSANELGTQLQFNRPQTYGVQLTKPFAKKYPEMAKAAMR